MKYVLFTLILFSISCKENDQVVPEQTVIQLDHIPAMTSDSNINVLVEIPAGSINKWEFNKEKSVMQMDSIDGLPRTINYLGYPFNYGMIPNTLSPKDKGGDGDPLDVIVLGSPLLTSNIEECKVLGVLLLRDRGETDDKLIAAHIGSPFAQISDIAELRITYPGLLDIIETWFLNYKGLSADGSRLMSSCGYGDKAKALTILTAHTL